MTKEVQKIIDELTYSLDRIEAEVEENSSNNLMAITYIERAKSSIEKLENKLYEEDTDNE